MLSGTAIRTPASAITPAHSRTARRGPTRTASRRAIAPPARSPTAIAALGRAETHTGTPRSCRRYGVMNPTA